MKKLLVIFLLMMLTSCMNVEVGDIIVQKIESYSSNPFRPNIKNVRYKYMVTSERGNLYYTNHEYRIGDKINR